MQAPFDHNLFEVQVSSKCNNSKMPFHDVSTDLRSTETSKYCVYTAHIECSDADREYTIDVFDSSSDALDAAYHVEYGKHLYGLRISTPTLPSETLMHTLDKSKNSTSYPIKLETKTRELLTTIFYKHKFVAAVVILRLYYRGFDGLGNINPFANHNTMDVEQISAFDFSPWMLSSSVFNEHKSQSQQTP